MTRQKVVDREELSRMIASLNKGELVSVTKKILPDLLIKAGVTEEEFYKLIRKEVKKDIKVPVSIFNNEELSALEAIVKYMKENLKLKYREIGIILNRDERNIWTTYSNAQKKRKKRFVVKKSEFLIPVSILQNRKLSVLENITAYLKAQGLTYHKIARLMNRDDRTIWTVWHRANKKQNI